MKLAGPQGTHVSPASQGEDGVTITAFPELGWGRKMTTPTYHPQTGLG